MRKALPIGISDFKDIMNGNYYFVDKSFFIKDLIDTQPKVTLYARPRRFGKTMILSMIRYFFDNQNAVESKKNFDNLAIAHAGEKYLNEQGKYPVIFLTLKDVKKNNWQDTENLLHMLISREFSRFDYLLNGDKLNALDKTIFESILMGKADKNTWETSLSTLTAMLYKHHQVKPILLIDEYDVPIQSGYINEFYEEVIGFMRVWLTGGLKDNSNLHFALLTGILRVAKESIFSGLNNIKVDTILSKEYASVFGFTQDEVEQLAKDYQVEDKLPELKAWYDGYNFGGREIYNAWSVINYFDQECTPKAYWLHTSANEIIRQLLRLADSDIKEKLQKLLRGEKIYSYIEENIVYDDINRSKGMLFSMLLMTGYLKIVGVKDADMGVYDLQIPNQEVSIVYRREILNQFAEEIEEEDLRYLLEDIVSGNAVLLEEKLQKILLNLVSFYDTKESFYHGLMLGLLAVLVRDYDIQSNRESGYGRFDLAMFPKNKTLPGVIMEFKVASNIDDLNQSAKAALNQIAEKAYDVELQKQGIDTIYHYGIAFCQKDIRVVHE